MHLKIAYHLSRDAREGQATFDIPHDIAPELLDFQAAAVRMAARTLQRRRGVMLGDVVGLGKTLMATAIARVMEDSERVETLILCPKNLEAMWLEYVRNYQLRGARVLPLSQARTQLADFARYRLVIVDESHNLRNAGSQTYNAVRDYIQRNDPYLLLLTATPYNVDFSDIADQLGLFLAPDDRLQLRPDRAIEAAGGLGPFMQRVRNGLPESLEAFRRSENAEDWRALMSQFLVRRTRGFIKKHYAEQDERGSFIRFAAPSDKRFYFPRRKPRVVSVEQGAEAELALADKTVDVVTSLQLARQRLGAYLTADARASADPVVERLLNRSSTLQGIVRIGLLKRLSSSRAALLLSLQRHWIRDMSFVHALTAGLPIPVGAGAFVDADLAAGDGSREIAEVEDGSDLAAANTAPGRLRVRLGGLVLPISRSQAEMYAVAAYERVRRRSSGVTWLESSFLDRATLLEAVEADIAAVAELLASIDVVDASSDPKVKKLAELATQEHGHEKVLVFTEYRDTADYIQEGLARLGVTDVASVSGGSADPTAVARRFSPASNAKLGGIPPGQAEIRVLVATDVLSEGQNLQDSRVVVNYDLPWATIRIVQRAGRVDRIGQEADEVVVYTFDVGDGLDTILRLRQRIVQRLNQSGAVLGSDDRFFGGEQERELLEGLYDERKANAFDDVTAGDVDPSSYAYEIWRTATEGNPALENEVIRLPSGVRSTIEVGRDHQIAHGVLSVISSEHGVDSVVFADRAGDAAPIAPIQALVLTAASPSTPMQTALPGHLDLLAGCVDRVADTKQGQTGMLSGVRKRVYEQLQDHERVAEGIFADREARAVVDELYRRPLTQTASQKLDARLRDKSDDLLELVLALAADGSLLVDDAELVGGELSIVASVGFRPRRGR